jgi:acyl-CoA thioesterase-1
MKDVGLTKTSRPGVAGALYRAGPGGERRRARRARVAPRRSWSWATACRPSTAWSAGSGWVSLLEKRLAEEKIPATVINASISGDTTSGGRSRLAALLVQHRPTHVILELGGNDALRGLPLSMTQANLSQMTQAAKAAGARVLLVGMQVPPNYGRKYGDDFAALFASVARQEGVALVPFMLKGVADAPNAEAMFQPDRIHPRGEAHPAILANIWQGLAPLLR